MQLQTYSYLLISINKQELVDAVESQMEGGETLIFRGLIIGVCSHSQTDLPDHKQEMLKAGVFISSGSNDNTMNA